LRTLSRAIAQDDEFSVENSVACASTTSLAAIDLAARTSLPAQQRTRIPLRQICNREPRIDRRALLQSLKSEPDGFDTTAAVRPRQFLEAGIDKNTVGDWQKGVIHMRFNVIVSTLALGSIVAGCSMNDEFTDQEWSRIMKLEPLKGEPPRSPYNKLDLDDTLAKLGQMLFFDKEVAEGITVAGPSGNAMETKKVACVNCHDTSYFADSHMTSPGALGNNGAMAGLSHGRSYLSTNTGQMVNLHWYDWTLWAGRFDSMVEHGTTVWGTSATVLAQVRFLYAKYKDEWNIAFPDNQLDPRLGVPTTDPTNVVPATGNPSTGAPGPFEMMPADLQSHIHLIRANLGRLYDTYPRKMLTPDSPFQRYVRDRDYTALTGAQKRGLRLFIGKASCTDCHTGPTLSDNKFHNIGAPNITALPGSTAAVAPNRGRAAALPTIVANLNTLEANPDAIIFNGAGKFSDDRTLGFQRLGEQRDIDRDHCLCRRVDAVADAAACTDAVKNSPAQAALRGEESLECLVRDDAGACTCRRTEAVTAITACTELVVNSSPQLALRQETKVACLQYDDTLEGMFRTPSLLNVAQTAPYFHSGLVQTLDEVLRFYNQGGGTEGTFAGKKSPHIRPLGLTETELEDLAEFLRSLTGKTPAEVAAEAKANAEDPSTVWDWTKNTAKPPLTGAGGTGGTGTGGMGGSAAGGRGGAGGAGGTAASGTAGMAGTGSGGSATGSGGAGGAAGAGGAPS
jgi:cytochrome c peroxidase